MSTLRTERTTLHRLPNRGSHERVALHAVLDAALVLHVGFAAGGQPYVLPMVFARDGDSILLHGSAASRLVRSLAGGIAVCATATIVDGLVLARSAFHHSMNYRSAVVLGTARPVTSAEEKTRALEAIVDRLSAGRSAVVRPPSPQELKATSVLRLPIEEGSAKIRTGPPLDDQEDYGLPVWAGVLPLRIVAGAPLADPRLPAGIAVPDSVARWRPEPSGGA